jgi:hypothetical protein
LNVTILLRGNFERDGARMLKAVCLIGSEVIEKNTAKFGSD